MSPLNITQPKSVYGQCHGYYKVMSNIPKMGQLPTPGVDFPSTPPSYWESIGHILVGNPRIHAQLILAAVKHANSTKWFHEKALIQSTNPLEGNDPGLAALANRNPEANVYLCF